MTRLSAGVLLFKNAFCRSKHYKKYNDDGFEYRSVTEIFPKSLQRHDILKRLILLCSNAFSSGVLLFKNAFCWNKHYYKYNDGFGYRSITEIFPNLHNEDFCESLMLKPQQSHYKLSASGLFVICELIRHALLHLKY